MSNPKKVRAPAPTTGSRYGRLTVVRLAGRDARGNRFWIVKCDCHRIGKFIVAECAIRYGSTKSCGCLRSDNGRKMLKSRPWAIKHGHTVGKKTTVIYNTWTNMLRRCRNPNCLYYHNYGGRGITVCERWQSFENFLADMGEPPPGMSLERKDNSKGYSPENCVWATRAEQNANRRRNVYVVVHGERLCLATAAKKFHFGVSNVRNIAKTLGVTIQQALNIVLEKRCQKPMRRKTLKTT